MGTLKQQGICLLRKNSDQKVVQFRKALTFGEIELRQLSEEERQDTVEALSAVLM